MKEYNQYDVIPIKWLQKSNDNLKAAKLLLQGRQVFDVVAFHAQQCVEKALKAFLLFKEGILSEGHSLPKLVQKCIIFDPGFKEYEDRLHILNSFYIETRYPAEEELNVKEEDAEGAIETANNILEYVCKKINIDTEFQNEQ